MYKYERFREIRLTDIYKRKNFIFLFSENLQHSQLLMTTNEMNFLNSHNRVRGFFLKKTDQ